MSVRTTVKSIQDIMRETLPVLYLDPIPDDPAEAAAARARSAQPAPPSQTYYGPTPPNTSDPAAVSIIVLLFSLAPISVLTVTRWIITGGWRLGPRW